MTNSFDSSFFSSKSRQNRKVLISTSSTIEIVYTKDILYLEAKDNFCKIYLVRNEVILSLSTFGKICLALDYPNFYQCHKSYYVNMDHVCRYYKNGEIELSNGASIPIARRRKEEFLSKLKEMT